MARRKKAIIDENVFTPKHYLTGLRVEIASSTKVPYLGDGGLVEFVDFNHGLFQSRHGHRQISLGIVRDDLALRRVFPYSLRLLFHLIQPTNESLLLPSASGSKLDMIGDGVIHPPQQEFL